MKCGYIDKSSLSVREGDWLMVDNLVFEGKRGSLDMLYVARDCGKLANDLIDTGNYEVEVYKGRETVEVVISRYPTYASTLTVDRYHPFKGLFDLRTELKGLLSQE